MLLATNPNNFTVTATIVITTTFTTQPQLVPSCNQVQLSSYHNIYKVQLKPSKAYIYKCNTHNCYHYHHCRQHHHYQNYHKHNYHYIQHNPNHHTNVLIFFFLSSVFFVDWFDSSNQIFNLLKKLIC